MSESSSALSKLRREYSRLDAKGFELLFVQARTFGKFQSRAVSREVMRELYNLLKWGPTSANGLPARFVFIESEEAKEKLRPCLAAGNVDKTMKAPVTVAVAADLKFWEHLPKLSPHVDMRPMFRDNAEGSRMNAIRDASLQGAYMIMAARALGLDCGPMAGFNAEKVWKIFFENQDVVVLFLCNMGYGETESVYPRLPRFEFEEVCKVV